MRYVDWVKNAETPDEENFYVLPYSEAEKKRIAVFNLLWTLSFLLVQTGAGLLNQSSSRTFWIFYPYVLAFVPVVYAVWGACSFFSCSASLSKKQYVSSLSRCKHSVTALLVLSVLQIVLSVVYLILHRSALVTEGLIRELLYLGCMVLMCALCVLYGIFFNKNLMNNAV